MKRFELQQRQIRVALSAIALTAVSLAVVATTASNLSAQGDALAHLAKIETLVKAAISNGDIPGAVVVAGNHNGNFYKLALGNRELEPHPIPLTPDTVFDLASLTKPIATATSVMQLIEAGEVRLEDRIADHLPEFAPKGKDKITIRQLLTHTGGLIPDNALSDYKGTPEESWANICKLGLRSPAGEKFSYTDVGFVVLAKLVEKKTGKPFQHYVKDNIFNPLDMHETGFLPNESLRARAAPTEKRDGTWMRGTVHDPRAFRLSGVAGHAGLFSTADDLSKYCQFMLGARGPVADNPSRILPLSKRTIELMTSHQTTPRGPRGLGWDIRSPYAGNRSDLFSDSAFGHGGFTGTALWIDPELDLYVIVLSSRLYPDGKGKMNRMAAKIGSIVVAATDPTRVRKKARKTFCGLDVLQRDRFKQLAGKRVGLITNQTGKNREGVSTIQLLHDAADVKLVRLFSPEHGLLGKLDIAKIKNASDPSTGLEVFSLYGETKKPTAASLKGLDVLVFDIQDIGTRFYTYISTMGLAIEAAEAHGVDFMVLDRPNPIGGEIVSGPLIDERAESFVAFYSIPIRHGMTTGEIAKMLVAERFPKTKLNVIPVQGWKRNQWWDETGLEWINPSPNMRSLAQATHYPGIGILETTNLSVGRGTDTPFEVIGAPWIQARELARTLNEQVNIEGGVTGVRFVPIRFTPSSSKHANTLCHGINIVIMNREQYQPVKTGFLIANTLRELYPDDWDTKNLNVLLRNQTVAGRIKSEPTGNLEALWRESLAEFMKRRAKYLMY